MTDRQWGETYHDNKGVLHKHFPLHEGQAQILQSNARFTAAIAGSGGGKTALLALWLMQEIKKNPQGKYLIVVPKFHVLRQSTLPVWQTTVQDLSEFEGDYKVATNEYHCPCGAKIFLRSAEDPGSFQGIVANAAGVDEGGLISKAAWDTVTQRVGYKKGRVLLTTTPYDHNWLYTDFYQKWLDGDKDYCVVQFPSTANPTYSAEEVERAKQTLPRHTFEMLYMGQWCRPSGLVFNNLSDCTVNPPQPMPTGRLIGGIDFGFNDAFAALVGVLDSHDILWLCYERYVRRETLDIHAKHLPKEVFWWADNARPDSIKDLRRFGFTIKGCKKPSGSLEVGINLLHQRIAEGKLKIIKGTCPNLLEEANQYRYPSKDEKSYGDVPVDANNHAIDALRYLVYMLDRKKRRR
jgi:PBSX family phage terminase large subunit